jgi:uncharacterized short protein YbdD (DUF466 family)
MAILSSVIGRVRSILAVVRRVVGVPDYDAYVAHVHAHHPDATPLGKQAFMQKCWEDRYTRPGNRCC